jgi:sulfatase modifying factor 1
VTPGKNGPDGARPGAGPPEHTEPVPHRPRAECLSDDEVLAFAAGTVAAADEAAIRGHLYGCSACCALVAEAARGMHSNPSEPPPPAPPHPAWPLTLSAGEVLLGRYRVIRFVARGGMGEVYEAHDSVLDETVALKTLVCTALDKPAAMNRFLAEVRTARQVTHRNICRILEFGFHRPRTRGTGGRDEVPFLTMEFLAGETLSRRIARKGRLSPAEVTELLPQIVAGVAAIHEAGIVHRDIKPQNIVILPGMPERVVVTDFGVARVLDGGERRAETGPFLVGTVDYMCPEQVEGRPPTPAFDVYALGVVLFEMLTGRRPFGGDNAVSSALERLKRPAPSPSSFVAGLDRAWDDLVGRCLARDPERRFARVQEVVAPPPARPGRLPRLPRGTRLLAGVAGAALLVLLVLGGIQLARGKFSLWPRGAAVAKSEMGPLPGALRPPDFPPPRPVHRVFGSTGCSTDMVRVADRFCIDRFEATVVDDVQERPLSPLYPPWGPLARANYEEWSERVRRGEAGGTGIALPPIFPYHFEGRWAPRAVSRPGLTPQGYVNKLQAVAACAGAGKRLCTEPEWRTACRGQNDTQFPYGETYQPDMCNINREVHPALVLHGVVHSGVLHDPRLNAVGVHGKSLLHQGGGPPECRSQWGDDFVYDMVGNIDEWVEGPELVYLGGYYAKASQEGCELRNDRHKHQGPTYYNYSVGFRCCDDLRPAAAAKQPPR